MILEDDSTLASYGVKHGVTIHVLEKKEPVTEVQPRTLSETEIQQLVVAFRAFTLSAGYRAALQRLSRPEVLENIIAATPGLANDPVAIAMIKDPELIVHMSDPETVRKVAKEHPSLVEAANHIAAHVHDEAANVNSNQAGTSTGYSYSLEALSDDEEMDSSSSDPPREAQPLTRNSSYNAITAAQLAAAIANATNTSFGSPAVSTPNHQNISSNVITSEMFSNAMQQAFATSPSVFSSSLNSAFSTPNAANRNEEESLETITRRLQPQLAQMREMGLTNESVNIRALQATSGDVQAAIDLVFNGVID